MRKRCYNKRCKDYKYYGGRGIIICDEWLNSFQEFYNWSMSHNYDDTLTIDRIDNNKSYSPNNCRWVDRKTQNNNTRSNVLFTYNGKTQNMKQWADELGVNYQTARQRRHYGWSIKECLFGKEVQLERD